MKNSDNQHIERLRAYWDEHLTFPSMAKLCKVVGMTSTGGVFQMLDRLIDAGQLKRVDRRIAPTKAFLERAVRHTYQDRPNEVDSPQEPSRLNLGDLVMPEPCKSFFVRVPDEKLARQALHQGDMLVIQEDRLAKPGDVVAICQGQSIRLTVVRAIHNEELVLDTLDSGISTKCGRPAVISRADLKGVAVGMFRQFAGPNRQGRRTARHASIRTN